MRHVSDGLKKSRRLLEFVSVFLSLAVTTVALVSTSLTLEKLPSKQNIVKVELYAEEGARFDDVVLEPGMTVERELRMQNKSTCRVFYRLYAQNADGGLFPYLQIEIYDGEHVLYSGPISALTRENAEAFDDVLEMDEEKTVKILLRLSALVGNEAQSQGYSFDLSVEAVEADNNPDRLFMGEVGR